MRDKKPTREELLARGEVLIKSMSPECKYEVSDLFGYTGSREKSAERGRVWRHFRECGWMLRDIAEVFKVSPNAVPDAIKVANDIDLGRAIKFVSRRGAKTGRFMGNREKPG
jgi:hypothetical protein